MRHPARFVSLVRLVQRSFSLTCKHAAMCPWHCMVLVLHVGSGTTSGGVWVCHRTFWCRTNLGPSQESHRS